MEEIVFTAELVLSPPLVLSMWAAGMAAGAAAVAWWRIVGPGFTWTIAGTVLLVGGWLAASSPLGVLGVVGLAVAAAAARRPVLSATGFAVATLGFGAIAVAEGGWASAVAGAVALGGITDEMLLGHWYLVSPQMPRWALRRLDIAAIVGLVADVTMVLVAGGLAGGGALVWAFAALSAMSILLMVGVWFSLGEPSYTGVMAATGLSYLAVLTGLGAVVVARALLA